MIMNKEDGTISLSMLIILSLMTVFSLYIYRLSSVENDTLDILKINLETENYTISESLKIIAYFKYDKVKWQEICLSVNDNNIDTLEEAFIVDEQVLIDDKLNKPVQIKAYLLKTEKENIYKLIVESNLNDIINQNIIYLQKKDDDCIVQRWER